MYNRKFHKSKHNQLQWNIWSHVFRKYLLAISSINIEKIYLFTLNIVILLQSGPWYFFFGSLDTDKDNNERK